ncbi:hypothetical protein JXA88_00310 [Candidatus Fermentibacteria bacterium]|nr:hypothetical protein [Candidatus Fermentibacteria bacterium]
MLVAAALATADEPRLLWSSPQAAQFVVEADTASILRVIRAGVPWPGTPVLVATSGPSRVEWTSTEAPMALALPDTATACELAPVAAIEGEGFFRSQHVSRVLVQPLQRGREGWVLYGHVIVTVTFPHGDRPRAGTPDPLIADVLAPLVINGPLQPTGPRTRSLREISPPPEPSCKIVVDHRGLYAVTWDDLVAAGVNMGIVRSASLRLWYHGVEQAFLVNDGGDGRFGPGDSMVFFGDERFRDNPAGRRIDYVSQYSREATYWLSWGGGDGLRWTITDATAGAGDPAAPWYWEWVHAEQENVEFVGTHNEAFNNEIEWYWQQLNASTVTREFAVFVDEIAAADSFVLRVGLQGGSTGVGHHSQFFVMGTQVGESWWGDVSGREALVFDSADSGMALPVALLSTPATTIGLKELPDGPSGSGAYSFLNWIEIGYPRGHVAGGGILGFAGPQGSMGERYRFGVRGLTDADVCLVNVTRSQWLTGSAMSGDTLLFSADAGMDDLIWLQHDAVADSVVSIVPYQAVDPPLDSSQRAADYIVVTHPLLSASADTLVALAGQAHGLRSARVDVYDLYDNFSGGEPHPDAVRDFLVCAFENWAPPAVSMAVLLGDASWDFLGVSGPEAQANLVPTWGNPGNDFYFTRLTHDGSGTYDWIPDIAVGRLAARSEDEARVMVNRVAVYLRQNHTAKGLLFVAHGSSDWEHQSFASLSNTLAEQGVPSEMLAIRDTVYADPEGTPGARWYKDDFVNARRRGPLLVHFMGRGDFYTWCMESHTTLPDTLVQPLPLPFLIGGSCHSGRFAMPDSSCLGEVELRAALPGAGSIGIVSSTGITSIGQAYVWSQYALTGLLSGQPVGNAYLAGVLFAGSFLAQRYILLADPAFALARPSLPDLTAPEGWLTVDPPEPSEGDPSSYLHAILSNDGCAADASHDSCWVVFSDSSASGVGSLGQFRVGLPVQRDTMLVLPWIPPPARGLHRISVTIDADNEIHESDETNNGAACDVAVFFDAPEPSAPSDGGLIRHAVQLVVASIPGEPNVSYRFQAAADPRFAFDETLYDSGLLPAGEYYTTATPPPLPERTALYWRCRAEDGDIPGAWSPVMSFEIDRLASSGGWRQRHWGQFVADSLLQCRVDTVQSLVRLATSMGADVALADSGATVVSTSSVYPGSSPAKLIGPGFFLFGNNDLDQTATIDLGSTRTLTAVGAEVWAGAMDRGVWSLLELAGSVDGSGYTSWVYYGEFPQPNLEIPARIHVVLDSPHQSRYIRARFGAGCPHPEALWGSRIYEVYAFPLVRPDDGRVIGPMVGPAAFWLECMAEALIPQARDSVLVTVAGYSVSHLAWEPIQGFIDLPAPGSWSLGTINPDAYPWLRMEASLRAGDEGEGPALTAWSVFYAPR